MQPELMRLVSAFTVVLLVAASGMDAGAAESRPALRHHNPASWRTIVIPAKVAPAKGVTTASIQAWKPALVSRPLTGVAHDLRGLASFYWQGQRTASGETFNPADMTAAHRTLPFGTRVRVTHTASGRSVIVRINDRGPFKPGRVIDLSKAAAETLQMTSAGLAAVRLEVVE